MLAAYRLYLADRDQEAFKARIIHYMSGGGSMGTAGGNSNLTGSAEER